MKKFVIAVVVDNRVEFHKIEALSELDALHRKYPEVTDCTTLEEAIDYFFNGDMIIGVTAI